MLDATSKYILLSVVAIYYLRDHSLVLFISSAKSLTNFGYVNYIIV